MNLLKHGIDLAERGMIPTGILRLGIRRMCGERLRQTAGWDCEREQAETERFVEWMRGGPIAEETDAANAQHYEVPAEFFELVLGPRRKYSCCYYGAGTSSLADAEERSLALTCEHAELADGQRILELGCGWGSLSLWMAERYPRSEITGVSNSHSQRKFIEGEAERRGLRNLRIVTEDVNRYEPGGRFDRIVSVEMFEHLRNHEEMLKRIARWLERDGKMLMHIFTMRGVPYPFETEGEANWMGRYFFTGGIMPSEELPLRFQRDLLCRRQWKWSGEHYQKTAEGWLTNLEWNKPRVLELLEKTYGRDEGRRWFYRWRMFFVAVAELFGYRQGSVWGVTHTLFERRGETC